MLGPFDIFSDMQPKGTLVTLQQLCNVR